MSSDHFTKAIALAAFAGAMLLGGCAARTVHTDEQFATIQRGMAKDEVLRALGPPDETMKFPGTRTDSLDYIYWDTWGYMCRFSVTFDESGHVVSTISARLNDGGNHGT